MTFRLFAFSAIVLASLASPVFAQAKSDSGRTLQPTLRPSLRYRVLASLFPETRFRPYRENAPPIAKPITPNSALERPYSAASPSGSERGDFFEAPKAFRFAEPVCLLDNDLHHEAWKVLDWFEAIDPLTLRREIVSDFAEIGIGADFSMTPVQGTYNTPIDRPRDLLRSPMLHGTIVGLRLRF